MGQKIHPLGFRVGITKSYQSQWFARFHKRNYAQTVLEDRLLRQNLMKLFPELLNPVLKKVQKRENSQEILPKITHIKIERGLIPYEIGIQIHAGNCELIKTAIDNLQINDNLVHNLQKTRRYLLSLKETANNAAFAGNNTQASGVSNNVLRETPPQQKLAEKRVIKRKEIRRNFRENLLQNVMIVKNGEKISRKLQKKLSSGTLSKFSSRKKLTTTSTQKGRFGRNSTFSAKRRDNFGKYRNFDGNKKFKTKTSALGKTKLTSYFGQSQNTKKFVDVFTSKMNQRFVRSLKIQMTNWSQFMKAHKDSQLQKYGALRYAPLGYQRKWSLSRLNRLQKQPLNMLVKLVKSLQKKAILKLDILQKDFLVLGRFSKVESFNYYQMIRFIKGLKQLIQQLKSEQRLFLKQKSRRPGFDTSLQMQQQLEKSLYLLSEKALNKKLNNIDDECRKIKFIDYLQHMVQKHRQKNIYLYLSTISDSRKYLRKIQKFTKQQALFLFGLDLNSISPLPVEKQRDLVATRVSKAFKQTNRKNQFDKNLQDIFLDTLQKQRIMCEQNICLTPKISIKFYSVKSKNLETKATLIADSIVDDLEKRKAFRRVIKQAKETLMANSKVKGVKIQVSGRLNGAEIARSEWVRAGRVPLQTLRANIDYCYKTANTIYGIIGVKVWIYKGYSKTRKTVKKSPNFFQLNK